MNPAFSRVWWDGVAAGSRYPRCCRVSAGGDEADPQVRREDTSCAEPRWDRVRKGPRTGFSPLEGGLDRSHRCQLVGGRSGRSRRGVGSALLLAPSSQAETDGSGWQGWDPSKPCPSPRCGESRSFTLFVTWGRWQQRGRSQPKPSCTCHQPKPSRAPGEQGSSSRR